MRLPHRITADGAAALLLAGAAAVLVTTPYDGGSCRNVFSAYALPAATVEAVERPAAPPALSGAYRAVAEAEADEAALGADRATVESALAAAEEARQAAAEAEEAAYETSWDSGSWELDSAELDVEFARDSVDTAEEWLAYVESEATGGEWDVYTDADVARAQEELDDARADLAEAEAALAEAQGIEAAEESAAASAEQNADDLAAAADTAEKAAEHAAAVLSAKEDAVQDRLDSAYSRVADLEVQHEVALAEWSHGQRLEEDEVVARNHVRDSCRENGMWRAGIAGLDALLLGAVAFRAWGSRLPRISLPWRRR